MQPPMEPHCGVAKLRKKLPLRSQKTSEKLLCQSLAPNNNNVFPSVRVARWSRVRGRSSLEHKWCCSRSVCELVCMWVCADIGPRVSAQYIGTCQVINCARPPPSPSRSAPELGSPGQHLATAAVATPSDKARCKLPYRTAQSHHHWRCGQRAGGNCARKCYTRLSLPFLFNPIRALVVRGSQLHLLNPNLVGVWLVHKRNALVAPVSFSNAFSTSGAVDGDANDFA